MMYLIIFFHDILHSSFHSTNILNFNLFSANWVKNMNMSYLASLFLIAYIMRLIPFYSFKIVWLSYQIFYEIYGCKDIGT